MSEMRIEVAMGQRTMSEVRPAIDAALQKEFPGGMLQRKWEGDVLQLSGPGAKGSLVLEEGRLIGRADLTPPASLMRALIEQKIGSAMKAAAAALELPSGAVPAPAADTPAS